MGVKIKIDGNALSEITSSKFFGEILVEENWLKDGAFSPTDIFLCQINLNELSSVDKEAFPIDKGMLYFFIDLEAEPVSCRVLYSDSADYLVDFNEDADSDYDLDEELSIAFEKGDKNTAMLVKDDKVFDGEICLLRLFPKEFKSMDFLSDLDGALYFVIAKSDLENKDFSKAKVFFAEDKELLN